MELTQSMQDYLKLIYQLEWNEGKVTGSRLAECLGVTSASVTNMVDRLAKLGLVRREPYRDVTLSAEGEKAALKIIRRHRLIELYLVRELGYSWDEVNAEAEKLEHVISEDFEDRIDRLLGYPKIDPHGAPIPTKDGKIGKEVYVSLAELETGDRAVVRLVLDRDSEMLSYLTTIGVTLGVTLEVVERYPFDGPIMVDTGDDRHVLSMTLARHIFVEPSSDEPASNP